ncbi:MAG: ketose-bisphosphate aldolase [Carnobacterium sp.]|nr:ketose-bisphosphate aldolase [Carnobacterium sp.]
MEFITLNGILPSAVREKRAIPQFNINGVIWLQAVLEAAQEENYPIIIGATDRVVDKLGGFKFIVSMVKDVANQKKITIPIVLHLDHGQSFERCKEAIDAGFSSVMFDGSKLFIDENIAITKKVSEYARKKGVSVEGEIGTVGGNEDGIAGEIKYASKNECLRLVNEANIDALAAALGSVHGEYKGEPNLGFKEMKEISDVVKIPLVLHGASGLPDKQIRKAIELGHSKININTELNQVWAYTLKDIFQNNPTISLPQDVFDIVRSKIKLSAQEKIKLFKN